jgi:RNA polymerase primary sigma factor
MPATDHESVKFFLNQAGRVPLLTAEEEIHLGHTIQKWQQLVDVPEDELTAEQRRTCRRGKRAKKRMVEANLRLVVTVTRRFLRTVNHLEQSDLIQEGCIGLDRAAEKFDPERGYKFSTYAYWWILQGITRAINTQDRPIRLPVNACERMLKIRKFIHEYQTKNGSTPTIAMISKHVGADESFTRDYMLHMNFVLSLDSPVKATNNDGEGTNISDTISDGKSNVMADIELDHLKESLKATLLSLDEITYQVVVRRYGLYGHNVQSHKEIAEHLRIDRARIKKTLEHAMNRMRAYQMQVGYIESSHSFVDDH